MRASRQSLGGMLIDTLNGLPATATAYFVLVASVAVPLNMFLTTKYAKKPECGWCLGSQ